MAEASTKQGHGMGTALEQKDWANMTLADLALLQNYYAVLHGNNVEIVWHSPRPFSSASIVRTDADQFLIKRSDRSFRSAHDILEEHAFIQHLAQHDLAVVELIENDIGSTVTEIDNWVYEIHRKVDAYDIYAEHHSWKSFFHPEHAYAAGKILAQLHAASASYTQVERKTKLLLSNQKIIQSKEIIPAILQRIASSEALTVYFQDKPLNATFLEQLEYFHSDLLLVLPKLQSLWTHNDLHASNLLWTDTSVHAEVAAVIDFGLSDRTTIPYDIAVAIERNFIDWLALDSGEATIHIDDIGIQAFLRGYLDANGNAEQLSFVPYILALAHIDFALSELEYFAAITQNPTHADAAYRYLIDHTH